MGPRYAENTSVSTSKSNHEIERTLERYGADEFFYAKGAAEAQIGFKLNDRQYLIKITLPDKDSAEFTKTPERRTARSEDAAFKAWEQACRQRWRALALFIKATLEAIECGIMSFDEAFLAHMMLPDQSGNTFGSCFIPQLDRAYQTGSTPKLLMK